MVVGDYLEGFQGDIMNNGLTRATHVSGLWSLNGCAIDGAQTRQDSSEHVLFLFWGLEGACLDDYEVRCRVVACPLMMSRGLLGFEVPRAMSRNPTGHAL